MFKFYNVEKTNKGVEVTFEDDEEGSFTMGGRFCPRQIIVSLSKDELNKINSATRKKEKIND